MADRCSFRQPAGLRNRCYPTHDRGWRCSMDAVSWEYWSELGSGFVDAILLLATGDPETWTIIRQSLVISITASVASVIPGVPIGAWVAVSSFPGRNLLIAAFNTGFGLPPVGHRLGVIDPTTASWPSWLAQPALHPDRNDRRTVSARRLHGRTK